MRRARSKTPLRDLKTYGATHAVRHPDCDYSANLDIHVTLCADRDTPFDRRAIAQVVCENVEFYCRRLRYVLYGYCLMPDHLHMLCSSGDSGAPLSRWLDLFKSYTTHEFMKSGGRAPLWQRSAHDHVCRAAERAEKVLAYIADNPVRAGLAERWEDWPWTKVYMTI